MKKTICFLNFFLILTLLRAQEIQWQNTIGGTGADYLTTVHRTNDGGFILGGGSTSGISGDKTEICYGNVDYWIVKTDSIGNIQWQNTIGANSGDDLYCLQKAVDGGFIMIGYSDSKISGDKTENKIGSYDYWIVKTDSSGNVQWENTIGGSLSDIPSWIQQTYDGGYIAGGYSRSNISGDKTENSQGGFDFWMVKIDSSGNSQWQNTIGGSGEDRFSCLQQTYDGGYILGGFSKSKISGDKTENRIGGFDYWIVKTDSSGNIQWQKTIGGNSEDELFCLQQTTDGGFILGGLSTSNISGSKTENCLGGGDYWIVKTDSTGNIQWQNTIGGSGSDMLTSLQQTSDGGYIIGGISSSDISGDKTENSMSGLVGYDDYWVVKTDSTGNIEWQNTIGGSDLDALTSLEQTKDGNYILGGWTYSNISGDKTENVVGVTDYWIVKLTGNHNLIKGRVFADLNNNNLQDTGEPGLNNQKVREQNTGRFAFSGQNGIYYIALTDTGNFIVSPDNLSNYNCQPFNYNVSFMALQQTDSLNDFAFQPSGAFNNLKITITPLSPFRPGFNAYFNMHYENVGTTTLNSSIIFYLNDTNYTYVSSLPAASIVTSDSIIWNNISLTPFQSGDITVTVHVNAGVPIGTQLSALCLINPFVGDSFQGDNYASWKVWTVGSFDPNNILVSEDSLFTYQFPNPPFLDYIIRFQNTGNDTAFNIKVLNPIDTNFLNLSSLEFVASSHPVNMAWIPWERNIEFKFDNILLPDSNVNEALSHGFVRYRIKPKSTLVAGDSILNSAYIYFDFNAPVATNTVITKVLQTTNITPLLLGEWPEVRLFPNPVNTELNVIVPILPSPTQLIVYDVFGRKMFEEKIKSSGAQQKITIDINSLATGVYTVEVTSFGKTKFVKQ